MGLSPRTQSLRESGQFKPTGQRRLRPAIREQVGWNLRVETISRSGCEEVGMKDVEETG